MKAFLKTSYTFLTAFVITAIVIAAIAAVATLGEDDKALYFESDTMTLHIFGKEYIASPRFVCALEALFDCNRVFLGERGLNAAEKALSFPVNYIGNVLSLMFGFFDGIIRNSV